MIALAILACLLLWITLASAVPFLVTLGVAGVCGAALALLFWKG